jgi:hypothetical protein
MRAELLVLLASTAFACLQPTAVAQTVMNPSGLRGGPTVSVPVGGGLTPIGGGPRLEPVRIDLKPTLPTISAPTVNQPNGSQNIGSDAPKQPVPPTPPPEPGPDGDAESSDVSGSPPTVDLSMPTGGQGGEGLNIPPTSSASRSGSSRWIWIGIGALAIVFFAGRRNRRR